MPVVYVVLQVLATMACNTVGLDVIITLAFSTVAIGQLYRAEGDLSFDSVQASWIGMYRVLLCSSDCLWLMIPPFSYNSRPNKLAE
jgi:hypothetical protein